MARAHPLAAPAPLEPAAPRTEPRHGLRRLARALAAPVSAATTRLRAVRPEVWFLVGLVLALLVFVVALFVEPGSVGRGGR